MADVLISADAHMVEPSDLWLQRLPKAYRDRAIWEDVVENPNPPTEGRHIGAELACVYFPDGGCIVGTLGRNAFGGRIVAGAEAALRDLDADGIHGTVMYPNMGLPTLGLDADLADLAMAHARVFNDYANEAYGEHRDRISVTAMVPVADPDAAVAEIERVADMGFRVLTLPVAAPEPYHSDAYERVWAAAEANGLTVTFHVGTGGQHQSFVNGDRATMTKAPGPEVRLFARREATRPAEQAVISLVGSGVTERFPSLQFVLVEFNAYWLAALMAGMDKAYTVGIGQDFEVCFGMKNGDEIRQFPLFPKRSDWPYPLRPSEYIRRQIHATFMDDRMAVACRQVTGVETLMWGNDYPHSEGTFPRSAEAIDAQFAGVDAEDRAAILGGTAARLFGLEYPATVAA